MSEHNTRVVQEEEGKPTLIEVPVDHACVVIEPSGRVDIGLLPAGDDDGRMSDGASMAAAFVVGLLDPEFEPQLRALLGRISVRHFGSERAVAH